MNPLQHASYVNNLSINNNKTNETSPEVLRAHGISTISENCLSTIWDLEILSDSSEDTKEYLSYQKEQVGTQEAQVGIQEAQVSAQQEQTGTQEATEAELSMDQCIHALRNDRCFDENGIRRNLTDILNPNLALRYRVDLPNKELIIPKNSTLYKLGEKVLEDGVELTVRHETEEEEKAFIKAWGNFLIVQQKQPGSENTKKDVRDDKNLVNHNRTRGKLTPLSVQIDNSTSTKNNKEKADKLNNKILTLNEEKADETSRSRKDEDKKGENNSYVNNRIKASKILLDVSNNKDIENSCLTRGNNVGDESLKMLKSDFEKRLVMCRKAVLYPKRPLKNLK